MPHSLSWRIEKLTVSKEAVSMNERLAILEIPHLSLLLPDNLFMANYLTNRLGL
jgi:hypothetical protein